MKFLKFIFLVLSLYFIIRARRVFTIILMINHNAFYRNITKEQVYK